MKRLSNMESLFYFFTGFLTVFLPALAVDFFVAFFLVVAFDAFLTGFLAVVFFAGAFFDTAIALSS
jgi:hypothetical protein